MINSETKKLWAQLDSMSRVIVALICISVMILIIAMLYLSDDKQSVELAAPVTNDNSSSANPNVAALPGNLESTEQSDITLLRKQLQEQQQQIDLLSSQSRQLMTMLSDIRSSLAAQSAASQVGALNEAEAIGSPSQEERALVAQQQEQKITSDFYMSVQNTDTTTQISERLNRGFLDSSELLNAGIASIDCRESSCLIDIIPPSGDITDDQRFEYQFHLSRVMGEAGIQSVRYLPSLSNPASGNTTFFSTLAK